MTPKVLEGVAKNLGWEVLSQKYDSGKLSWTVARSTPAGLAEGEALTVGQTIGSDGDLLLAILNRAIAMGYEIELSYVAKLRKGRTTIASCHMKPTFEVYAINGLTILEAAMRSFAKLKPL